MVERNIVEEISDKLYTIRSSNNEVVRDFKNVIKYTSVDMQSVDMQSVDMQSVDMQSVTAQLVIASNMDTCVVSCVKLKDIFSCNI